MSTPSNTALVTLAAKEAVQQTLSAYAVGVANHLSGDWAEHPQVNLKPRVYTCVAGSITTHTGRLLATNDGVDQVIIVPCVPVGSGTPPAPKPIIVTQPVSLAVAQGGLATFTVAALSATALHYQWTRGTVNIIGATGSSLTVPGVATLDHAAYACVVTNANGSTTTNTVTLTVVL